MRWSLRGVNRCAGDSPWSFVRVFGDTNLNQCGADGRRRWDVVGLQAAMCLHLEGGCMRVSCLLAQDSSCRLELA
jgi:hypothetical protein